MSEAELQEPEEVVGLNVRRIRQIRGWTQEELAERSELDRTYVGGVERGERNLTVRSLFAIAAGLEVDPRKLLCPADEFEYP